MVVVLARELVMKVIAVMLEVVVKLVMKVVAMVVKLVMEGGYGDDGSSDGLMVNWFCWEFHYLLVCAPRAFEFYLRCILLLYLDVGLPMALYSWRDWISGLRMENT